ncbi:MAG: OmpA family protein [Gammaproteobacteria bacterium]|nr:OmpA family protein [Gammaproteobacteria bacterium]
MLLVVASPAQALQHYEVNIEAAKWSVSSSPVKCELKQQIPGFGNAVFMHSAGGELSFFVKVSQPPVKDSIALLYSSPPYWKPDIVAREISRSSLIKSSTPVYFTRDVALRMLYELDQGMQPSLHFRDFADSTEDVSVAVSTVHFRDHWPDFVNCQTRLLPFGFDDVKNTSMMFDSGSARLNKDAKELLDRVALYVKNDKTVKKLRITGHTDSIGFRYLNQLLSQRRARAVSKYLISKGVPKTKLSLIGKGEARPHVSNVSKTGRKFNRRVQVQLIR